MFKKLKLISKHEGFRRYFKNTSWLFAERIIRLLVGLFVGIWVARYLGPEDFGLYSYVLSFVALFSAVATLGLDGIVVRELVRDATKTNVIVTSVFYMKLMGAVAMLAFLAIFVNFTSNDRYTNVLVFIIASATVFQSFNIVDMYFQAKVLSKYVVFVNITSLLISSLVKIALIYSNAPLLWFACSVLFDSLIVAAGYLYIYTKHFPDFNLRNMPFNTSVARNLLRDSWPLILSGVVITIYMKIDQVMLKEMMDSEAVGHYAAAVKLSEAWYFVPVVLSSSLFPAIVNAKLLNEELYYKRLQQLFDLLVWISISIALITTFLGEWVVNLLYGHMYHQAGSVLVLHIWASVFVFLGVASGKWYISEKLQMLSFWRTFSGMCINLVLNYILIPRYGVTGAAFATLVSYFVAGLLFDFCNTKTKNLFYMKLNTLNISRIWQ